MIDPPYEVKSDYATIPRHVMQVHRAWNVGILVLWYPLLRTDPHKPMLQDLARRFPQALRHEVRFPPARTGHGMTGSGMFVINPPFGLEREAARLSACFETLG